MVSKYNLITNIREKTPVVPIIIRNQCKNSFKRVMNDVTIAIACYIIQKYCFFITFVRLVVRSEQNF